VTPLVIDEIGVTADREALGKLLTIADGDLPPGGGSFLRVKAIEALGRIQAQESASTLKRLVEAKKVLVGYSRWSYALPRCRRSTTRSGLGAELSAQERH